MSKERPPEDSGPSSVQDLTQVFEEAIASNEKDTFVLRLYVTGSTPHSLRAIANLRKVCEEHLKGRYDLEVIDVYQQPERAASAEIIAAPTLVKHLPPPLRRFIGDLSNVERILVGLNLRPKEAPKDIP